MVIETHNQLMNGSHTRYLYSYQATYVLPDEHHNYCSFRGTAKVLHIAEAYGNHLIGIQRTRVLYGLLKELHLICVSLNLCRPSQLYGAFLRFLLRTSPFYNFLV